MTTTINITLREGDWEDVQLDDAEAAQLADLGRALASRERYWRNSDQANGNTAVIDVRRGSHGWRVRVPNATGLIRTGNTQICVDPKIPVAQFASLLIRTSGTGRTSSGDVTGSTGAALWDLLAAWFITDANRIVEHELLRDYVEYEQDLQLARGSIDALVTARSFASGRLAVRCRYEEFDLDTPLNRMVKAGLAVIARGPNNGLAKRAARLLAPFREVGAVQDDDWRTEVDRRAHVYRHAVRIAYELASGSARTIGAGTNRAECFLIPTARVFEDGIRSIVADHLAGSGTATAGRFISATGNVAFDPDIVIRRVSEASPRVADVKYRSFSADWPSDVRNQAIAFAAAAGTTRAGVIGIETVEGRHPRPFSLDAAFPVEVTPIMWRAWHDDPERLLTADLERWLA